MKTKSKASKAKSPTLEEARLAAETADAGAREAKAEARSAKSKFKAARKAFKRLDQAAKSARKKFKRAQKLLETLIANQPELKKRTAVRRGTPRKKPAATTESPLAPMPMVASHPAFAGDPPKQSLE